MRVGDKRHDPTALLREGNLVHILYDAGFTPELFSTGKENLASA